MRLRCSLDTAPTHGRNVSIADYLKKVEAASDGQIKTEIFSSGSLFPDLDVAKALIQGQVEMACPGSWTMTGFIPDCDMFQLPILYGQSLDIAHKVTDGRPGQIIADEIQQRLRSHVLGPWLDLGFQNWYSTSRPLNRLADLKGMKIRNSGGAGQAWRARFVGAIPNTTAWPNVPLSLSQGTFDGLVSTNESVASAKLWEAGVKFALEDHQFVGEYIPMVSLTFWNKLSPELQKMMTTLWAQNIPGYRANMAAAQTRARALMEEHGIKVVDPSPEQTAAERKEMVPETDELAKQIKISPDIVKAVTAEVGTA
jgi:C4-dicarboxylate-binding protein DctP